MQLDHLSSPIPHTRGDLPMAGQGPPGPPPTGGEERTNPGTFNREEFE
jgi:hypothetical protein